MPKTDHIIFFLIASAGVLASLLVGHISGTLALTSFDSYRNDSSAYVKQAFALLDERTLGEELGDFRKPLGYPLFLAFSYGVFGRYPIAALVMHAILFWAVLYAVWRVSARLFGKWFVWIPVVFTAGYWGITFYVFKIESELFSLFLATLLILLMFRLLEAPSLRRAILCGFVFALLILTKPIALYALPFFVGLIVWRVWQTSFLQIGTYALIAAAVPLLAAGGWMMRNHVLTGDYQIEQRTGHIIWVRGSIAESSASDIASYTLATLTGDFIADYFFPGYAADPVPFRIRRETMELLQKMRKDGVSEYENNRFFLEGGVKKITAHVPAYLVTAVPGLFALNEPVNHKGFSLAHLFAGTHEYLSQGVKIFILVALRMFWFLFLVAVVYGGVLAWRTRDIQWRVLLFFVLYNNAVYALAIMPAEPRFLVPVLPWYGTFFAVAISSIMASGKFRAGEVR